MFTKKFSNSKKGSPSVRGLDLDSEKIKKWYNSIVDNDLQLNLNDYISLSTQKLDLWAIAKCCSSIIEKNYPTNNSNLVDDFKKLIGKIFRFKCK